MLLKRISPIAEKRGIKIRLETMREVIAEVDEVKLSLACNNLIENAVKYNDDNGSVDVSLNADHKFFYIRVKDTGCGIPVSYTHLVSNQEFSSLLKQFRNISSYSAENVAFAYCP